MTSIVYTMPKATFNSVGGDYHDCRTTNVRNTVYHDSGGHANSPLNRLLEHVAPGAFHDSEERGSDAPKCHPETRKAVQGQIMSWIKHGDQDGDPKKVLWLSGPAGAGKTAIAGTIADQCEREGLLAASFFFSVYSGSANRRSKRSFVLTLAYGLMQQKEIIGLKEEILSAVEDDPTVLKKHLDRQMEHLILRPLQAVRDRSDPSRWPKVIIVDGVDECVGDEPDRASNSDIQKSREENHKAVLRVLARAVADSSFPFRILIASRSELVINSFFQSSPNLALRIFLDDQYDPDSDIRLFLQAKLDAIQRESTLPNHWPPRYAVDLLVERASGQFIYAATVLRFVEDTSRPPQQQLELIVNWAQRTKSDLNPFASLDALYTGILYMSPDPALAGKWLVCLNCNWQDTVTHDIVARYTVCNWYRKAIIESFPGESTYLLGRLSSLVSLTEGSDDVHVKLYHRSLLDFLCDASRSGNLHVSVMDTRQLIMDGHYHTLKNKGCRGVLPRNHGTDFAGDFFIWLTNWIDPCRSYEAEDVAWWWAQGSAVRWAEIAHDRLDRKRVVKNLFFAIDSECSRYACRPSCELWRKAIQQHGKKEKWRQVPTWVDLHRERLSKLRDADYVDRPYDFRPLWDCFDDKSASERTKFLQDLPLIRNTTSSRNSRLLSVSSNQTILQDVPGARLIGTKLFW